MPIDLLNNPELMEKTVLNREWLSKRTKVELQRIIFQLTKEISNKITTKMAGVPEQLKRLEFVPVKIKNVESFTRLPIKADTALTEDTKKVILVIPDSHYEPIGIEIVRSVVLGRGKDAENVDLDLTEYDAGGLGVSRRHAILQTISGVLYVVDSGSTNGTYLNGKKLSVLEPTRVADDDIISLGGFHFKVMVYEED
ncbi:MAG: FHA domain-containing protein [Chloroflexota bacterium]